MITSRTLYILASNEGLARYRAITGGPSVYDSRGPARDDLAFLQAVDGTQCSIKLWIANVQCVTDGKVDLVASCVLADTVTI
jgi:hypothetical protein